MGRNALALQQAARLLLVSVVASLVFLGVQSAWLSQAATDDYLDLRQRVATSLQSSLAKALWSFDEETAGAIISDIARSNPIRSIQVTDSNGALFTAATAPEKAAQQGGLWETYLGWLLDLHAEQSVPLNFTSPIDPRYQSVVVGSARITYDDAYFISTVADRLRNQAIGILFIVTVVALSTSVVFHSFVSRPIVRTSHALEDVDPEDPSGRRLPMPPQHRNNEFGRMIERFNGLLLRLAQVQTQLRQVATRDALTDLPNRSLLLEMIDAAIEDGARTQGHCAVMFLDLDMFKHVNDSLGHGIGDQVLKTIGQRLDSVVQGSGTVGRLGGDEFVVLINSYQGSEDLARLARRLIFAVATPVDQGGTVIHPSTSVGIACYPSDGDNGTALLRNADTAMYAAKALGPGQWSFFDRSMTENALIRLRTEASLREAVENQDFILHYQPKLDLTDGRIYGCEALARWMLHGELVPPGRFIPIAEETGLIYDIGLWVLREALSAQKRWIETLGPVTVAVNVSARQLKDDRFLTDFIHIVRAYGVDPTLLEVEVTESSIMSQIDVRAQLLGEIKALGVKLAVDDFGTGYSSLAYLKLLPLDVLKIDRSFINDVPEETSIPRMIIGLAEQLGLTTVAEGIETTEQLEWLKANGADKVQGYLIGRPLPEREFVELAVRSQSQPVQPVLMRQAGEMS